MYVHILCIQGVPGGKVNILGGRSIGHSKQKLYMCMCSIPNGFREELFHCTIVIARMKERQDALRRATRHVFTRLANCIDVDGGIFENVL
jgi:hypothetical protein